MTTQQERKRIIDAARATLIGRLDAGEQTTSRCREFSGEPDPLAAWQQRRKRDEPEEPPPVPEPAPAPIDWPKMQAWLDSHVAAAIERERNWWLNEFLPPLLAEVQDQSAIELSYDMRKLNAELAELRAVIGELRALMAADRAARGIAGPVLDLPKPATPPN
jgi:hypothetical protein